MFMGCSLDGAGSRMDLNMAFEKVYTVCDYYDGPRSGIADYSGQPHHYDCEWNEVTDDFADTFVLTLIDSETLNLALEQWTIWRQWEEAFHRGEVSQSTHPTISGQNVRYADLEALLKARIAASATRRRRARATFRTQPDQADRPRGVMRDLEVEWQEVEAATD
jgi:hypothetical protein